MNKQEKRNNYDYYSGTHEPDVMGFFFFKFDNLFISI